MSTLVPVTEWRFFWLSIESSVMALWYKRGLWRIHDVIERWLLAEKVYTIKQTQVYDSNGFLIVCESRQLVVCSNAIPETLFNVNKNKTFTEL